MQVFYVLSIFLLRMFILQKISMAYHLTYLERFVRSLSILSIDHYFKT